MAIPDLQEAIHLIEGGQADEAISLLTAWARQMPMYAALHVVLARAYEAAEQWDAAREAWKDAHFLMPNSPAVLEGLARMHTTATQPGPQDDDLLTMDLDLQAELEATLEALFNPFTLPDQAEAPDDGPAAEEAEEDEENDGVLAVVEAALAAAADSAVEEEVPVEEVPTEQEDLYQEKAVEKPDADAGEALSQEETAEPDVPPSIYDEIEQLIEEKARRKAELETADDVLGDWQEFEDEPDEGPGPGTHTFEDLERLISELETARIVPQPELEDIPPPDLNDDIEDVVSETLARIFASQEQYREAARVYQQLALQHPDEADRFNQLAAEMHTRAGGPEE